MKGSGGTGTKPPLRRVIAAFCFSPLGPSMCFISSFLHVLFPMFFFTAFFPPLSKVQQSECLRIPQDHRHANQGGHHDFALSGALWAQKHNSCHVFSQENMYSSGHMIICLTMILKQQQVINHGYINATIGDIRSLLFPVLDPSNIPIRVLGQLYMRGNQHLRAQQKSLHSAETVSLETHNRHQPSTNH